MIAPFVFHNHTNGIASVAEIPVLQRGLLETHSSNLVTMFYHVWFSGNASFTSISTINLTCSGDQLSLSMLVTSVALHQSAFTLCLLNAKDKVITSR